LVGFQNQMFLASTIGWNSKRKAEIRFQGGEQQSQTPRAAEFNRCFRSEQIYSSKYRLSASKKDYFFVLERRKFSLLTAAFSKTTKIRSDKSECLNTLRYTKFAFLLCSDAMFPFTYRRIATFKKTATFVGIYGEGTVSSHI